MVSVAVGCKLIWMEPVAGYILLADGMGELEGSGELASVF
jgi:hypothetical protein